MRKSFNEIANGNRPEFVARRNRLAAVAGVMLLAGWAIVDGIFAVPLAAEEKSDEEETEVQLAARKIVEPITLTAIVGEKRQPVELVKQPVLRYGDIPRANDKGSVWIWQRAGRPQAIMELFRSSESRAWVYVIHSLSNDPLEGDFGERAQNWATSRAGVQWKGFPDAPSPADRPVLRARQMKDLSQKFTAHEFWDPNHSRFELRLLVKPIHQYSAPESGLLDGAVFVLCHETNPEVVLLIEAVKEQEEAKFRYSLARLGHAELHVAFGGEEVWRQERIAETKPNDPYWMVFRRIQP